MPTLRPKLRILGAMVVLTALGGTMGCNKLGLANGGPTAPSGPFTPGSTINYAAIGASDVTGIGSSVPCLFLFDCSNGTGYVFVAARTLRSQTFTVNVTNLGIPTAVISGRLESLGRQYGHDIFANFIDVELPLFPSNANLVTIFAGGNDVDAITSALDGGAGGSDQAGFIDAQVRAFGDDYGTLLAAVKARAPSAQIVAINLPNFAGIPMFSGASLSKRQAVQRLSVGMTTTVINPLTSQNVRVVDLMCDPRFYQASTFSADGFHPNDAGYAVMGDLVVRAATSSSFSSPPAACAQNGLVP